MGTKNSSTLNALLGQKRNESLDYIKEYVTNLWAQGTPFHPYYTLHGPQHSLQVETIINHILAPEHNSYHHTISNILDPDELFYLLASAWLHDVGMILPADESEKETIVRQGLTIEDWLRKEHHNRSRIYVEQHWKELKLDSTEEARFIGLICQAHRGGNLITDDRFRIDYPNIRFLGAILRVADELDITKDRAPENLMALRWNSMDDQSKWHWIKHMCVKQAKARHLEARDENPSLLMLTYHFTIRLPNHKYAEIFWERILRPIREVIDYEGVNDILRQKHIFIAHSYFTKDVQIQDHILPDNKPLSEYLPKFLNPPDLISNEAKSSLELISWKNPAVSEMLRKQSAKVIDIASQIKNPRRIEDAIIRFLDKISNVSTLSQIELAREQFKDVIREMRTNLGTKELLIAELETESSKLADLGWRLMAYVQAEKECEVREAQIRHLCGWLGNEADPVILWVIRKDPSESLRKFALSTLLHGGDGYYQVIVDAIEDLSSDVRLEAVRALGHLHGPEVRDTLEKLTVNDPDISVRRLAREILLDLNHV